MQELVVFTLSILMV